MCTLPPKWKMGPWKMSFWKYSGKFFHFHDCGGKGKLLQSHQRAMLCALKFLVLLKVIVKDGNTMKSNHDLLWSPQIEKKGSNRRGTM